jgi:aspartate aminotransferase
MTKSLTDRYAGLPKPEPDIVFAMNERATSDKSGINLVIGAYRDGDGRPFVLHSVTEAEQRILAGHNNKEYQGIEGHKGFLSESAKMLFGSELATPELLKRVAAAQSIGGTGAVRLGAELMKHTLPITTPIYISDPTWPNHPKIFLDAGFKDIRKYRYFDPKTNLVDFDNFFGDLNAAPEQSVVVLHLCAHNPTGADPSPEQWEKLAELTIQKNFNIIFDSAYQGYASGSLDRDAIGARIFASKGIEFSVAQSYSKNMGLYGERLGCYVVLCGSEQAAGLVLGVLKNIIRPMYSNPPLQGARIAHLLLSDPELNAKWTGELKGMADRIMEMRKIVYDELIALKTPGSWEHVIKQIGMFSYLGLSKAQCQLLISKHHIYLMESSRVSIAGLTKSTAVTLAKAIDDVVRNPQ